MSNFHLGQPSSTNWRYYNAWQIALSFNSNSDRYPPPRSRLKKDMCTILPWDEDLVSPYRHYPSRLENCTPILDHLDVPLLWREMIVLDRATYPSDMTSFYQHAHSIYIKRKKITGLRRQTGSLHKRNRILPRKHRGKCNKTHTHKSVLLPKTVTPSLFRRSTNHELWSK